MLLADGPADGIREAGTPDDEGDDVARGEAVGWPQAASPSTSARTQAHERPPPLSAVTGR